jgi:hypothetical protein
VTAVPTVVPTVPACAKIADPTPAEPAAATVGMASAAVPTHANCISRRVE